MLLLHLLLTSVFVSSIHCQIKFLEGVIIRRSTNTSNTSTNNSSSVITDFAFPPIPTKLSTSRPTPRSAVIRFPGYSTAAPSSTSYPSLTRTTSTNIRLFVLNEWGHIECKDHTDCPSDFVDFENKKVIKYSCAKPIGQIISDREGASFAASPENEDPADTCAEDLNGYYCSDPTRPGCEVCAGFRGQVCTTILCQASVPSYCWQPARSVFDGSLPNYLTGTVGQTVSSLGGLQGQKGEDILR